MIDGYWNWYVTSGSTDLLLGTNIQKECIDT